MKRRADTTHYAKSSARAGKHGKQPRRGLIAADRFRETRLGCLLTVAAVADELGVSQRTIENWEAGRTRVPYAAYRLLRVLRHYELPDLAWEGYRLHGDTLWTPEGRSMQAHEMRWWALLVAQAREFRNLLQERRQGWPKAPALGLVSFSNKGETLASHKAGKSPIPIPHPLVPPLPPRRLPLCMAVSP